MNISHFLSASIYNTIWAGLHKHKSESAIKHYKVLWITTLIRQLVELQQQDADGFYNEFRERNQTA